MQENKMLKSVIVGCGQVAGGYDIDNGTINTHAKAYQMTYGVKLTAATDVNRSRAQLFSKQWGLDQYYSDFELMLHEQRPDIVSICTPDETHIDILKQCHKHQCVKAVWCEKPIATDMEEAKNIVRIYREKKIILAINYVRRWDLEFQQVGDLIKNGEIGIIKNTSLYYTKGICHNGSHAIDLFISWFGNMTGCEVFSGHVDFSMNDPTVSARALFGKTPVFIIGLDERDYTIFEIDVLGSKGRIQITRKGINISSVGSDSEYDGYRMLYLNDNFFNKRKKDAIQIALENIVQTINNSANLIYDGENALKTLLCCNKIINLAEGKFS